MRVKLSHNKDKSGKLRHLKKIYLHKKQRFYYFAILSSENYLQIGSIILNLEILFFVILEIDKNIKK